VMINAARAKRFFTSLLLQERTNESFESAQGKPEVL
jgi:hypothetical protein